MMSASTLVFSARFLTVLVYACIGLAALSAVMLLVLLIRDWSAGRLW